MRLLLVAVVSFGVAACKKDPPVAAPAPPAPVAPVAPSQQETDEASESPDENAAAVSIDLGQGLYAAGHGPEALRQALVAFSGPTLTNACGLSPPEAWPEQGVRTVGCHLLAAMPWQALAPLSASKVFRSGPHSATGPAFDVAGDFGHYDPAFVDWAIESLGPHLDDPARHGELSALYAQRLRPLARTLHLVELELARDAERRAFHVARYAAAVKAKEPQSMGNLESFMVNSPLKVTPELLSAADTMVVGPALGFWLRRELDGTRPRFAAGLRRVLSAWDDGFRAAAAKAVVGAGAEPAWSEGESALVISELWRLAGQPSKEAVAPLSVRAAWRRLGPAAKPVWSGALARRAVFRSGQPKDGAVLELEQLQDFGHYDVEWVRWLARWGVPFLGDAATKALVQRAYDGQLRTLARAYWLAWRAYEEDAAARERDQKAFTDHLAAKTLPPRWFATLERPKAATVYGAAGRQDFTVAASISTEAQAFWLRRSVDGTAAEFAAALGALVQAVDQGFVTSLAAVQNDAGAAVAPAAPPPAPTPAVPAPR